MKVPPNLFALNCISKAVKKDEWEEGMQRVKTSFHSRGNNPYKDSEIWEEDVEEAINKHLIDLGRAAYYGLGITDEEHYTMNGIIKQQYGNTIKDEDIFKQFYENGICIPKLNTYEWHQDFGWHFEYYKDFLSIHNDVENRYRDCNLRYYIVSNVMVVKD